MAGTSVQANNASVEFRGKTEKEMPSVSQAQNRLMHAAAAGNVEGVSPKVGKEFVKADHGRKIKKLPKHVKHAHKRGLISDKQMRKMEHE
jgi:anaerobic ribonucleoside-triphosphate reductase